MKKLFKRLFKSTFFRWLLTLLAANYIRLVYYTSRVHREFDEAAKPYARGELHAVYAFWHGRLLMIPMLNPTNRKMQVLISTHRDGEMIARTMHRFDLGTVRGSTTRGGATAAMQAVKALQAGQNVAVTPDGPKGPLMKLQPGVLTIAQMAGVPVLPVTYSASRFKRMRTWDRFFIALPFGTLYYRVGAPMMDATAEQLENEMVRQVEELDIKAGCN